MSKYEIFNYLVDGLWSVCEGANFTTLKSGKNKAIISNLNAPLFNYVIFGELNDQFIHQVTEYRAPFLCWVQNNIEEQFAEFCVKHNLVKAGEAIAHKFDDLNNFEYQKNESITLQRVKDKQALEIFDNISSITFQHAKGMAFEFLQNIVDNDTMPMFLAYQNNKPVGCCMLTLLNNVAVLCWAGVLPEHRCLGIATEMSKFRMNYAKQKGFDKIYSQNLETSIGYYQKMGFKAVGTAMHLYAYIPQEDIVAV